MRLVFVKANKIGSKIIRWGTGEPASHVAVIFEHNAHFYHSYLTGIHLETDQEIIDGYDIVSEINIHLNLEQERRVHDIFKASISPSSFYDYLALGYFTYRAVLHKFLGKDYPRMNAWQEGEGFLCTEVAYLVANALTTELATMVLPENFDYSMVTPWQLYELLVERIQLCKLPFVFSSYSSDH